MARERRWKGRYHDRAFLELKFQPKETSQKAKSADKNKVSLSTMVGGFFCHFTPLQGICDLLVKRGFDRLSKFGKFSWEKHNN